MIHEDIKNFNKQFSFRPAIENGKLGTFRKFVVAGMGGSNLAADLVKILRPDLEIVVHRDYGLPKYLDKDLSARAGTLVVLSSYSGNTEETTDAYEEAGEKGLKRVVVTGAPRRGPFGGGELLTLAERDGVPYIKFPGDKIQPRVALGWSFLSLLKIIGDENLLKEAAGFAEMPDSLELEKEGEKFAGDLENFTPVIYASNRNKGLSYIWKIVLNETGKIPAFANVLPELNHNEMTGFDKSGGNFFFVLLKDNDDNPRILKRMDVLKSLYEKRGFEVRVLELQGSPLRKIFSSFLTANWTAYYLALRYGFEPEAVPMIEEFKKLIK
ncbi:MAG: SIS domain-containing protein [Candidatus Jorgensenbacteria bacterium]